MADRCTLHVNKLEAFKVWLQDNDFDYRPGKGEYQVLQVQTKRHGWQVVFKRADMPEHYSINDKLYPIVKRFIKEGRRYHNDL